MQRKVIAWAADSHAGNRVGLLAPGTKLTDIDQAGIEFEYEPMLSPYQEYLWKHYMGWMHAAREFAGEDELILIHNGDAFQGKKHMSQLMTTSVNDQIQIAKNNLLPWIKQAEVERMILISGTGAHNFGEASGDILLKGLLDVSGADVKLVHHGVFDVDGFEIDATHHGPHPGTRSWLRGNVARFYLRDMVMQELMRGHTPPGLYVRAHFHTYVNETLEDGGNKSSLVILPSMCGLGEYARQAVKSPSVIENGLVLTEIIDGELVRIKPLLKNLDIRTKVKL